MEYIFGVKCPTFFGCIPQKEFARSDGNDCKRYDWINEPYNNSLDVTRDCAIYLVKNIVCNICHLFIYVYIEVSAFVCL